MLKQKEAVYNAVMSIFEEHDINFEPGMITKDLLNTEMKKQVNEILFQGFKEGEIELTKSYDDTQLRSYCSGLQNNWLRKDKRYNDGVAYVVKNKGSRTGSKDAQVKNLRLLKKKITDPAEIALIDEAIAKRIAEIKPKAAEAKIDVSQLPESLKHLVETNDEVETESDEETVEA